MAVDIDAIDYWICQIDKDIGLKNFEQSKRLFYNIKDYAHFFTVELTGIFAFMINDTLSGDKVLSELIFYIYPSYRGNLKLVRKYINKAERIARENSCTKIAIGANIGFKDDSFYKLLNRWGYRNDTAVKELV